jgi:hypothetical protein
VGSAPRLPHEPNRQFGELLAQLIAAKTGLYEPGDESQADLLRRLRFERVYCSAT